MTVVASSRSLDVMRIAALKWSQKERLCFIQVWSIACLREHEVEVAVCKALISPVQLLCPLDIRYPQRGPCRRGLLSPNSQPTRHSEAHLEEASTVTRQKGWWMGLKVWEGSTNAKRCTVIWCYAVICYRYAIVCINYPCVYASSGCKSTPQRSALLDCRWCEFCGWLWTTVLVCVY